MGKYHTEAQRAQRIFCDGKISHGGHGETEGLRVVGAEKSRRGAEGAENFFATGKSRTEGTERRRAFGWSVQKKSHRGTEGAENFLRWENLARRARRGGDPHIRENTTQRHRGHRGARAWRASGILFGWKNHAEAQRSTIFGEIFAE